ncbi:alanine racemase C-terminal domain-containing protein [Marisediminicola sp. UYEF4]|uniref:alanine racemase C-terminal domain-containing protein n=1 Tax=Marisediminicola sp. UYEF4 TaxID=1756384 RepID=UPI00339AA5C5
MQSRRDGVTMSVVARSLQLSARQIELLRPPTDDLAVEQVLQSMTTNPPRLTAEVLAIKHVGAGAGVSYGHTFRTSSATTLLLVAIGYGHGLPRKAGNRASVTWGDHAVQMRIVGRVAMDVLVVDAGDAPVTLGDTVVIFGDPRTGELSLEEWCRSIAEHPFSVLACLAVRLTTESAGE